MGTKMTKFRDLNLIGLHGKMNAGKDATFASMNWNSGYTELRFAEPIKQAASLIFGWSRQHIEDRVLKETVDPFWGFAPRLAMQTMGTEWARKMLRDDIWLKVAEKSLMSNIAAKRKTVVTDVRFDNEAEWIIACGGVVVEIFDPTLPVIDSASVHPSERGVSHEFISYHISNNKDDGLDMLDNRVEDMMASYVP